MSAAGGAGPGQPWLPSRLTPACVVSLGAGLGGAMGRGRDRTAVRAPRLRPGLGEAGGPEALRDEDEFVDLSCEEWNLAGQEAADVSFAGCRMKQLGLAGSTVLRLRLVDCRLETCDLSAADLDDLTALRVEVSDSRLSGTLSPAAKLTDVRFSHCKLDQANLRFAQLTRVVFEDCVLVEADFHGADLTGTELINCDLSGAEFSKATMTGARLSGSKLATVRGAGALRGAYVSRQQITELAWPLASAVGLVVDDEAT
jgi:uncharacterized protein YjbI with pentapeptide repeats